MFNRRAYAGLFFILSSLCVTAQASAPVNDPIQSLSGSPVNLVIILTALSFIPLLLIAMTTFTRNIIVLSMVRHGLGLQQTPPNMVLIILSLFLALVVMTPTLEASYQSGIKPYLAAEISLEEGVQKSWVPMRDFMVKQTHEKDIQLVYELAKKPLPATPTELSALHLTVAFMLSELKIAFQIGFIILLPFLVIDLIVASILMSLGMIMVPPITISLPIKIMLFLLIDGWGLLMQVLVRSAA